MPDLSARVRSLIRRGLVESDGKNLTAYGEDVAEEMYYGGYSKFDDGDPRFSAMGPDPGDNNVIHP